MDKIIKFINSDHKQNYIDMLNKFKGKLDENIDNVLRLLSMDEVYTTAIKYFDNFTIKFNDLLKDSSLSNTGLFISELACSLYRTNFSVKSISSARNLDNDARSFIIDIIDSYIPKPQRVSGF